MPNTSINAAQFSKVLEDVSTSFKSQTAKTAGHKYVTLEPNGAIAWTENKAKALSFKELSLLVKSVLSDEQTTGVEKKKILDSFGLITEKFKDKKINFFVGLFFGWLIKDSQVSDAKQTILQNEKRIQEINQIKSNFIDQLIQKGIMPTPETGKAYTFTECYSLYKKSAVKLHPDKGGDVDKFKELNSLWETFKSRLQKATKKDADVNTAFLQEVDRKYGVE